MNFKAMIQRLDRWEYRDQMRQAILREPHGGPKRAVPDWLQACLESQGFAFDPAGQVISSPDRPSATTTVN